jgi:tyrosine-protein phosphatase YwqE
MFSFFRRTIELTTLKVDIHAHLLPAIDDGAKNMEKSIELIRELKAIGYKKLITTPHVSDMFPNTTNAILEGYHALKDELQKREIDIEIEVAAEYYADAYFDQLLERGDILTFGDKKYLLFELSYFTPPSDLDDLVYDMKLKGYTPVLAHPERYEYFHDNFGHYHEIKEMGLLFQINLNSLSGYYGEKVQRVVEELIKNGMVDFAGSDTHHMSHIKALKKSFSQTAYKKMFKNNRLLNTTLYQ